MGIQERLIEDVGLRRGVSRLTPEIIEKTVNAVLKGETGAAAAKAAFQMFGTQFRLAITSDANQQRKQPEAQAAWIAGR